jgi:F420H(2)-dependent quinone reductase
MQKLFSSLHAFWYRLFGGRLVGRVGKAPVLLLITTGRKSGKERQSPLIYQEDNGEVFVVASNGGRPHHPAWYLNLSDNPTVKVRIGSADRDMVARTATDEERERIWPRMVGVYKSYDSYVKKTDRRIPVVVLTPA